MIFLPRVIPATADTTQGYSRFNPPRRVGLPVGLGILHNKNPNGVTLYWRNYTGDIILAMKKG
jgi:hypothetical protein